jgi:hypothetical protein
MIWRFVMPLSVGQTIKVRWKGGGGGCRQETYKKAGCYYVAEKMTVRQKTWRQVQEDFTIRRNSRRVEEGLTSDFMRKRNSPLPLQVIEENYVTQQETCYVTGAIYMSTLNHGPIKCLGKREVTPVPNPTSRTSTENLEVKLSRFQISVPESGEWSV